MTALRASYYCRFALLIVDEIGYLPVTPGGYNLFFQLVNARYEKGYNPNLETRLFRLGEIFVASALLDRLLHHAVAIQIEGSSSRQREHADLLPEAICHKTQTTANPIPATLQRRGPTTEKRRRRIDGYATQPRWEFRGAPSEEIPRAVDNR